MPTLRKKRRRAIPPPEDVEEREPLVDDEVVEELTERLRGGEATEASPALVEAVMARVRGIG